MCSSFDSDTTENLDVLKQRVEGTLELAYKWFTQNRLNINPSETELLVLKPREKNLKRSSRSLSEPVKLSPPLCQNSWSVHRLGAYMEEAGVTGDPPLLLCARRAGQVETPATVRDRKAAGSVTVFPHVNY